MQSETNNETNDSDDADDASDGEYFQNLTRSMLFKFKLKLINFS